MEAESSYLFKGHSVCHVWTASQTQATWIADTVLLATIIVLRLAHGFVVISLYGWNSH